jgi:hypothetical protein
MSQGTLEIIEFRISVANSAAQTIPFLAFRRCLIDTPITYLWDVLTRIAAHPAHRLAELLPNLGLPFS